MFVSWMPLIQSREDLIRLSVRILTTGLVLMVISLFFLDQRLATFFSSPENMELWKWAREITDIGLGAHYFGFSIVSLVFVYYVFPQFPSLEKYKNFFEKLKIWSWNLLAALTGSGICLRLAKYLAGRIRPNKTPHHDPFVFSPLNSNWDFQSFPSGHAQVLFCVATTIAVIDPRRWWLWFGLATFFSLTRVGIYAHFLSDIFGGASIGFLGTLWVLHLMQKHSSFKFG